jgi:hypothetical protein
MQRTMFSGGSIPSTSAQRRKNRHGMRSYRWGGGKKERERETKEKEGETEFSHVRLFITRVVRANAS